MRHRYVAPSMVLLVVVALLGATACGGRGTPTETIPSVPAQPDTGRQPTDDGADDRRRTQVDDDAWAGEDDAADTFDGDAPIPYADLINMARSNLRTIYFGYDSFELTPSSQRTLRDNAEWLKAHPELKVVIEGHCDERGTIEYNLALGEKRAGTVRDYMSNLGVSRSRVRVITYGEEKPVDLGHTEGAWSRNRRAEFKAE